MPAQQYQWIATAYLDSGTIARGSVACLNEEGTRYVVATTANRTAAGRRSACIALTTGDADSSSGSSFEAQYVGTVPPSISGLGDGDASYIRVSSTGVLERVASFSSSDDVCGHCDADGTAYVCFPLVGLGLASGSVTAALPDYSIQYRTALGTLGGAANASISTDGYTEHGASSAESGSDRFPSASSVKARNSAGTYDLTVWQHYGLSTPTSNTLAIGGPGTDPTAGTAFEDVTIYPRHAISFVAGRVSAAPAAGMFTIAPSWRNASGTGATARFTIAFPNFAIGRVALVSPLTADPFNGALGIELQEDQVTVPSAAPTAGYYRRSNPSNHHPEVLLPGDDPTSGWRDLLSSSGRTSQTVTTANPSVASLTADTINCANASPGGTTILGFPAPAAGVEGFRTITNKNADSDAVVFELNDAGSGANGITYNGASLSLGVSAGLSFSYDHSAARWVPILGATLS